MTQMDADPGTPATPPGFHLLAKPSGSTCNIDCTYCFFFSKEALYPNEKSRMSDATLEAYIQQLLESHRTPTVTVAWQGGEPTLMKVEFFRRSIELVEKYRRPGQTVEHTFQTNGILLDDEWCSFFKEHNFLVGLSVDGPREIHNTYRVDRGLRFRATPLGRRHRAAPSEYRARGTAAALLRRPCRSTPRVPSSWPPRAPATARKGARTGRS